MTSSHQTGAVTVPLVLALIIITSTSFAVLGNMSRWKNLAETQLRLDECVGKTAIELRSNLNAIEASNRQIALLRIAAGAAPLPPIAASTRTALIAEMAYQEQIHLKWSAKRALWILKRGCDGTQDLAMPLPSFPYTREPPDSLGPKPLRWSGPEEKKFFLTIRHSPRFSGARVYVNSKGGSSFGPSQLFENWKCQWASHL